MRPLRVRFGLRTMMMLVAIAAVEFGLMRFLIDVLATLGGMGPATSDFWRVVKAAFAILVMMNVLFIIPLSLMVLATLSRDRC